MIEDKPEIMRLKEKGLTMKEVSIKLGLPYSSVMYHYSEDYRRKAIKRNSEYQKSGRMVRGDAYRKYQREYHKKRYWAKKNEEKKE